MPEPLKVEPIIIKRGNRFYVAADWAFTVVAASIQAIVSTITFPQFTDANRYKITSLGLGRVLNTRGGATTKVDGVLVGINDIVINQAPIDVSTIAGSTVSQSLRIDFPDGSDRWISDLNIGMLLNQTDIVVLATLFAGFQIGDICGGHIWIEFEEINPN